MDKLSKKLIELNRLLKSKHIKDAFRQAREKERTVTRRRGDQSTAVISPTKEQSSQKKSQKELENKMRNDKSFKDAALRTNKRDAHNQKIKTARIKQQNKGYDEAVADESNSPIETVGTKKRTDKYINQMSRRKEAGVAKLINRESKVKKTLREKLEDLKKGMKQGGIGGAGSIKAGASLPSINKLSKPGHVSIAGKTGIPGIGQPSKKNPIKSAEQTHNKDIKDIKMKEAQAAMGKKAPQMIKFEKNGQWSFGTASSQAAVGYDDAPDSVIDGATVNEVEDRGSDVNIASVSRPGANTAKSDYGPKKMKLYNEMDNAKRKKTRTPDTVENIGPNKAVRQYTSAKGGTAQEQATRQAARDKAKSKNMPVKGPKDIDPKVMQALRDKYDKKGKS